MKRSSKLLMLVVGLVILIGAYFLIAKLTAEPETNLSDGDGSNTEISVLYTADTSDVTSLTWTYQGEEHTFNYSGGSWVYADDSSFNADSAYLDAMLESISEIGTSAEYTDFSDLADYGLAEPAISVTSAFSDGSKATFDIGSYNRLSEEYYFLLDGDTSVVYSGCVDMYNAFSYELYDLLLFEDVPVSSGITAFTVKVGGDLLEITQLEDSSGLAYVDSYNWFTRSADGTYLPLSTASVSALTDLINALTWYSCVSFNASSQELASYGLDEPMAVLSVESAGSDAQQSLVLYVGGYMSDSYCYVRFEGSNAVYTLDTATIDALMLANYDSLRPDDVCLIDWDTVTALDISCGGKTYHVDFSKTDSGQDEDSSETVYTCDGAQLDSAAFEKILSGISGLTMKDTVAQGQSGREELLSFVIYRDTGDSFAEMTMQILAYSSSACQVLFGGRDHILISRYSVSALTNAIAAAF